MAHIGVNNEDGGRDITQNYYIVMFETMCSF